MYEIKMISTISRYNDVGAKMLAKYGIDKNEDGLLDLGEVNGDLTIEKYREIASAGDSFLYTISYLDVLTYEGYKISQAVREQIKKPGKANNDGLKLEEQNSLAQISARGLRLDMLDMGSYKIMKDEVSVILFKTIMEGYKIDGEGAGELESLLADKSKEQADLTWVSWMDAREFVKRLNERTNRKFRLPKIEELNQVEDLFQGENWDWTETKAPCAPSAEWYYLAHIGDLKNPFGIYTESRRKEYAIRLVEDK